MSPDSAGAGEGGVAGGGGVTAALSGTACARTTGAANARHDAIQQRTAAGPRTALVDKHQLSVHLLSVLGGDPEEVRARRKILGFPSEVVGSSIHGSVRQGGDQAPAHVEDVG